eukprot:11176839-Lingulodinium_polyedra.AAC.1
MASFGLDIQDLSKSFDRVWLHCGADGASTCELVIDIVKCLVQPLGNVIVLDSLSCLMRACNR